MIRKVSSRELMDTFSDAMDEITSLKTSVGNMKTNVDARLSILRNMEAYEEQELEQLKLKVEDGLYTSIKNRIVLARADRVGGTYELYGSTIHPAFLKEPTQVFNFYTTNGYVFKDNVTVKISEVTKPKYKGCLMHDSIAGQPLCFEELETGTVAMDIIINPGNLLGSTECNCIEFMPWIPGSIDLSSVSIYTMQNYKTQDPTSDTDYMIPDLVTPQQTLRNMGNYRLILDRKYNIYKVTLIFNCNYRNANDMYPFGFKHIYFLNADFNTDSYVVVKVQHGDYIDSISEKVTVVDQTGTVSSTCKEERAVLYVNWANGVGDTEITTSKGVAENPLVRDTKEFYLYYPIQRATTAFEFDEIISR